MFSGIVEAKAPVRKVEGRGSRVSIALPRGWRLKAGQSVAVDGICSTVLRTGGGVFGIEYMPETLRCTTARDFAAGRVVNLERSLRFGSPVDGHFVQGHVDDVGKVARMNARGNSREITVRLPKGLQKFIAQKGAVTVNGVALTVARVKAGECTVALIPYTLSHTNLGTLKKGDVVNIEVDLIARYLAKLRA